MLVLLLENPSDDSVELAIGFLKECGQKLSQVSPRGLDSVFSTLRNLLHESTLDKRTQYMIEVLFAVRKDQFKANPAIQTGLDLVDENDQYTHMLTLDDPCEPEPMLGKATSTERPCRDDVCVSFQMCSSTMTSTRITRRSTNKYERPSSMKRPTMRTIPVRARRIPMKRPTRMPMMSMKRNSKRPWKQAVSRLERHHRDPLQRYVVRFLS